jgi:hypothetical protein
MSHSRFLFYCFCEYFLENILEYSWNIIQKVFEFFLIKKNHTILLRFMFKIWQKISLSKKFKSIYKYFYYLETNVTMFNECFC